VVAIIQRIDLGCACNPMRGVGESYGEGDPLEVCNKWMIRPLG
jgi:hypothetical protein